MKKITIGTITGFLLIFSACTSESTPTKEIEIEKTAEEVADNTPTVQATNLLAVEVSGMSCEMACGGAIREGLIESGGVARVQFDFEMGRETNIAKISYNQEKIQAEEITKIIRELNEKQFTIGKTEELPLEKETARSVNNPTSSSSEDQIHSSTSSFELPNFIDLFKGLLQVGG